MSQTGTSYPDPNEPPPREEPAHDVPVYPERDPPSRRESPGESARATVAGGQPGQNDTPPGESGDDDVDEDDLDPQKPHSPPDAGKKEGQNRVIFDENEVPS